MLVNDSREKQLHAKPVLTGEALISTKSEVLRLQENKTIMIEVRKNE